LFRPKVLWKKLEARLNEELAVFALSALTPVVESITYDSSSRFPVFVGQGNKMVNPTFAQAGTPPSSDVDCLRTC
jgi:hypothetical protein